MDVYAAIQGLTFSSIVAGYGIILTLAANIDDAGVDTATDHVVFHSHGPSF